MQELVRLSSAILLRFLPVVLLPAGYRFPSSFKKISTVMTHNNLPSLSAIGGVGDCLRLLEGSRTELLAAVGTATDESLFAKPIPNEWSGAETIEHIARVEESVARMVAWVRNIAQGKPTRTVVVQPGEWRDNGRAVAPDRVAPRGQMSRDELIAMLWQSRQHLLTEVQESGALLHDPASFTHPFLGELNGLGWLQMAAYHEPHHLPQLRNTLGQGETEGA